MASDGLVDDFEKLEILALISKITSELENHLGKIFFCCLLTFL